MRRTWPQIAPWPDKMRFLLDENVSGLAADCLRALGHDRRHPGTQAGWLDRVQTRAELYDLINCHPAS